MSGTIGSVILAIRLGTELAMLVKRAKDEWGVEPEDLLRETAAALTASDATWARVLEKAKATTGTV